MADAAYGSLPFAEQIAFFRRKLNTTSEGWTDVYARENEWAFTVAGANRDAIVRDFRAAVDKAIAEGTTLETFRKDFDAIVARHGWDYNGGRDWRSRVIYETNLSTSYAAGRYEQLQQAPFWQYQHADWVENPRHDHLAWDGLILARDDPWWQTHFPPNGWGCQCSVKGLWSRNLRRLGKSGPDKAPPIKLIEREVGARSATPRIVEVPEGIDPGFEYAPGSETQRRAARVSMRARARPAAPPVAPPVAPPAPRPAPNAEQLHRARVAEVAERVASQEFVDFFNGAPGAPDRFAMAVLGPAELALFGATEPEVWLSQETLSAHKVRHPEIGLAEYRRIAEIFELGEVWAGPAPRRFLLLRLGDKTLRAAVKVDAEGREVWFLSLVASRKNKPPHGAVRLR